MRTKKDGNKNSTLDDIAAVIGFTATLRLCVWFGDVGSVYIPVTVDDGQLLVRHIGKPAAIRLSKEWPESTSPSQG